MGIENYYLQEVNQVFYVHVDAHPLVVDSGHVDEHIITNDFPRVIERENEMPINKETHANSGVHTTLRLRMRCRTSVQ